MDVSSLTRQLCMSRISFGVGLIVAPKMYARFWAGPDASERSGRLLARALGPRIPARLAGAAMAAVNAAVFGAWLAERRG